MSRKPRLHYENALYHVIVRGNNKEYIFNNDIDKDEYLKRVSKYIEKYNATIYSYVIMDNHCHLLIEVSDIPIFKIMQLIQQTYTSWYNRNYKRSGHVFEQRYKSILVDKDSYLISLVRYIHQNPIRANMSDINYCYSSHKDYIKGKSEICSVGEVLSMFSDKKKSAIKLYTEFMDITDNEIKDKDIYDLSPSFEEIKAEINNIEIYKKELAEIVDEFKKRYDVDIDMIKGRYKKGDILELRNKFVIEVLNYKAMSQTELAEFLGISNHLISKIWVGKNK